MKDIIGYKKIEENLWQNFLADKLHHCNLITGEKGNGKANFVKEFAKKIIFKDRDRKQEIESHPDILLISAKAHKKNAQEKILIDDIREIKDFTNLSSGISKNKIIIIDAIDNMNKNAFNAVLKTIEEPKSGVFIFLINHNIKNIPETIKSRCNIIKIKQFNFDDWSRIIRNQFHDISEQDLKNLYLISSNSIKEAIFLYQNNWLDTYKNLIFSFTLSNELEIINFCEKISSAEINFDIFIKIMNLLLLRIVKIASFKKQDFILTEESLFQNVNINMEKIFSIKDKINNLSQDIKIFNLDKKYFILNIILLIKTNLK